MRSSAPGISLEKFAIAEAVTIAATAAHASMLAHLVNVELTLMQGEDIG